MNRHPALFFRSHAQRSRLGLAALASAALVSFSLCVPGCGGSSSGPSANPDPLPTPTPTPAPTPTPTPPQPAACSLTAPKVDCSTRPVNRPDLADDLQAAIDAAVRTPGVMYSDRDNNIYDAEKFRTIVVATLAAKGMCGAWDWGNEQADEIFVRSADGCVIEQYDLLTGDGGVRPAGKGSMRWQAGWGDAPVPGPKPNFPKEGDLACPLPGDRTSFVISIRNTPGEYGREMYDLMTQVLAENPTLFDKSDYMGGQGEAIPDQLRLPGVAHPERRRLHREGRGQAPRERLLRLRREGRHPQDQEDLPREHLPRGDRHRSEPAGRPVVRQLRDEGPLPQRRVLRRETAGRSASSLRPAVQVRTGVLRQAVGRRPARPPLM